MDARRYGRYDACMHNMWIVGGSGSLEDSVSSVFLRLRKSVRIGLAVMGIEYDERPVRSTAGSGDETP
jgi:hypothetical protein